MEKYQLTEQSKERSAVSKFYGYNHGLRISSGEMFDMKNMTSSYFPVLSPRHKRAKFNVSGDDLQCLFSKDKLVYINNGSLYYAGSIVSGIGPFQYDNKRVIVSMGAYIVIFPDKIYLNTNDLTDYGNIEAHFTIENGTTTTFTLCADSGTAYGSHTTAATAPTNPNNGDLWLDTSATPNSLKQYSSSTDMWLSIATTYVKIASPNIGASFSSGDCVTISGATDSQFNTDLIINKCDTDYIVVTGIIDGETTQTSEMHIDRNCPDIDYCCEGENRIWGCNSANNEVFCCKLGDFKNWKCYAGIASDSYAATVGTDGAFTGACRYGSYVMFFKENCIHKIYNVNPPYQISTSFVRGVQKGSERSLVVVNETLFYKSPTGICAYEGGSPVTISGDFGTDYYCNAVGGSFRDKYYICMTAGNKRSLFVYDTNTSLWHKEDDIDILEMANNNSNLYMLYSDDNTKKIMLCDGEQAYGTFTGNLSGWSTESAVVWEAVSGLIGLDIPEYKFISRFIIRLSAKTNTSVNVFIEYDSSGTYTKIAEFSATSTHSKTLSAMIQRRCDHFRLKISGTGEAKIYSITYNIETGGELH